MSEPRSHPPTTPGVRTRRIVHLLDPEQGGEDSVIACRAMHGAPDLDQHVWMLGTTDDEALVRALGVDVTARISTQAGPAYRSAQTLGRLHTDRAQAWGLPADAVVCWSPRAARLAEAEMWDVPRRILVLTAGPGPADEQRTAIVAPIVDSGVWTVLSLGQGLCDLWAEALVQGVTPLPLPAHRSPTFDADRAAGRAALGVREDEHVLMLLSDPALAGDAHHLASIAGLIFYAGVPLVAAASSRSHQVARASRYVRIHHRAYDFIPFDGPLSRALPAADVILWEIDEQRAMLRPGMPTGGALMAACAAAAGTPLVAPDHLVSRDVLGLVADDCLSRGTTYPDYAYKLLPLMSNPERCVAVGAKLRAHWEGVGVDRFASALRAAIMGTRATTAASTH